MSYSIIFTPEANDDLTEILGWFTTQTTTEIKKQFIAELSKTLKNLERSPNAYSIRLRNIRCAVLKKYSYNIYYWVDINDTTINILAILHQKRNPQIWKDRL
jgi:plasmid stabilization system protein ParE